MAKKVIAGCLAMVILGGLAYYSSYLYSSRQLQAENARFMQEQSVRQKELLSPDMFLEDTPELEDQETELTKRQEVSSDPDSVQTESKEYGYYLVEESGYVNIYLQDKTTIFEYTDIAMDTLPEELQTEIRWGKGLPGERELYDFLENYSS
ncbi:MAG: hypothetical protein HFJ10_07900 [Lachnospiraceae bacterium]|nr:hypothetical protein [Lachnospiraceae bacterium]